MRVISQNGMINLPYENSIFYIVEKVIYVKHGDYHVPVAEYNSEQEAKCHLHHLSNWTPISAYQFPKRKESKV